MLRLITGCGRGGTKFVSRVLKRLGYEIPHEAMGRDGSISFYAVGLSREQIDPFDIVLHQVREPLASIGSIHTIRFWEMDRHDLSGVNILATMPQIRDENATLQAAKYWYWWNLAAAEMSAWTYRVEALTVEEDAELFERWRGALDLRDLTHQDFLLAVAETKKTNTRVHRPEYQEMSWESLSALDARLTDQIRELAASYGYRS